MRSFVLLSVLPDAVPATELIVIFKKVKDISFRMKSAAGGDDLWAG